MSILSEVAEEGIISNFAVLLANGCCGELNVEYEEAVVGDNAGEEPRPEGVGVDIDRKSVV